MSARRRAVALSAGAVGTVGVGVAARMLTRTRKARAGLDGAPGHGLGSLHSSPRKVVTDDGVELYAEVDELPAGASPGDPTLVFVHGYALNLDCWHFQREHFRGSLRMVFYDQRSHGRSGRSPEGSATVEQLGRDLMTVLDDLADGEQVVLVGHSMGGMTLLAFAEQHPELFGDRVVGAALVSTTAGRLRVHRAFGPLLPDRLMGQVTNRLMAGLARTPRLVDGARRAGSDIGYVATGRFAFGTQVPPSYVAFVDDMLAQTPFEVLAEFFPNFDALDKFAVLEAFSKVPTVILCGTKDLLTSIGHSRKMAGLIDGARLVECEDAGHMVIMESSEQVNDALDDVVRRAGR